MFSSPGRNPEELMHPPPHTHTPASALALALASASTPMLTFFKILIFSKSLAGFGSYLVQ